MNWQEIADREMVELCLQGEVKAWQEFLRRFHPLVAGVVAKTLRRWTRPSPNQVDDLVQESLSKLYANDSKALREFDWRHENAFRGFLKVVASNTVRDHVRKHRKEWEEEELPDVPEGEQQKKTSDMALLVQQITRCLEKLIGHEPDSRREIAIFLLYYRYGLSANEVARVYDLSLKKVENSLARLVRLVKEKCLKPAKI